MIFISAIALAVYSIIAESINEQFHLGIEQEAYPPSLVSIKVLHENSTCEYADAYATQKYNTLAPQSVLNQKLSSSSNTNSEIIVLTAYSYEQLDLASKDLYFCIKWTNTLNSILYNSLQEIPPDAVIEKILDSGPAENRIDVVFMGDGYTITQKDMFFKDVKRLVDDMWSSTTFAPVLPLFNVWAIFTPSEESGIGEGGSPKNTSYGLYRDGTELRGIYPSLPKNIRSSCKWTGKYACDYATVIANDDYYGGLGGEFVIATRSLTSGTIVLRHEMGHNFINVGEEYDGGEVYSGVNSSPDITRISWKHWLSDPKDIHEERIALLSQDYAWYDLAKGSYFVNLQSDGSFSRWKLVASLSGVETNDSLIVLLDGKILEWKSFGNLDRSFYEWEGEKGLSKGKHVLEFKQGTAPKSSRIRQLCSLTFHEYGNDAEFQKDNSIISAYPSISLSGKKSFRPTNEGCLMRNMTTHNFCSVCMEGMWNNLMNRLSLIDNIKQSCISNKSVLVELKLLPLGKYRENRILNENIKIFWRKNEKIISKWNDHTDIVIPKGDKGWKVHVELNTPFVRNNKLKSEANISQQYC